METKNRHKETIQSFERSTVEVKGEWLIAARDDFYKESERFGSRLFYFLKVGCT